MTEKTKKKLTEEIKLLHKRVAELRILNSKHKHAEETLRHSEQYYRELFDQGSEGLIIMTLDGKLSKVNRAFADMHGYTVDEVENMDIRDLDVLKEKTIKARTGIIKRMQAGEAISFEVEHYHRDGHIFSLSVASSMVKICGQQFYLAFHQDITERKRMENELQRSREELHKDKIILEQKNLALTELLEHLERTKNKIREDIAMNMSEIIMPILKKLELKGASSKYIVLLRHHLNELVSSYGRKIAQKSVKLSPREIELCNLLKGGLRTKEISELLNLSDKTVDKHRRNIRKKLAISKKKVNLTSFLQKL